MTSHWCILRWPALGSVGVAITTGCGSVGDADSRAADTAATVVAEVARGPVLPEVTPGTLRMMGSSLHFAACGATDDGDPLEDATDGDAVAVVESLGPDGVTALVQLDGNRLVSLHYAAPEGPGCGKLPPTAEVEAHGQEPFWFLSVAGEVATVRTPEELDGVRYSDGRWSIVDASHWRYDAARAGDPLVLELVLERCSDAMSGARYPLRATLSRGGATMQGCALEGRGAQ
ncbi:MAG TPA: hypothetical protein VGA66_10120 [Mycobacterium sp.]